MGGAINKADLFTRLPRPWAEDLRQQTRASVATRPSHKLVVLDDDPTGTQTVYDVPVLTSWEVESLRAELEKPGPCFYILTNSRSLAAEEACALNREIAWNLKLAGAGTKDNFSLVSRSDSTLRGHFPGEPLALTEVLGDFDALLVIPFFEAGGRYTINDVHYVAEGDTLVPAGETPFAQDAVFGYRSSNLREWVAEKFGGAVTAESVASISLGDLRRGGPRVVSERLFQVAFGNVCVVNAACDRDLEVLVQGILAAEAKGRRYLFRTAASFVAARLGLEPRPLWQPAGRASGAGGLIVVGSYVPKTSSQLEALLDDAALEQIELSVDRILNSGSRAGELSRAVERTNRALSSGRDAVAFTSRKLVTGADSATSLAIGQCISTALVELVQRIGPRPRYLVAKGGITSSDVATKGLGVKRAMVLGQILPGVPVWELGPETGFPGLPYVVFPGNVGGPDALKDVFQKFNT